MQRIRRLGRLLPQPGNVGAEVTPPHAASLPLPHRRAAPPLIGREEMLPQRGRVVGCKLRRVALRLISIHQLVDPPGRTQHTIVVMALAGVGPVGDEDVAVGSSHEVHAAEEGVGEEAEVVAMARRVAHAFGSETVMVDPPAVQVERQHTTLVGLRPAGPLVDHQPDVRMPAASGTRAVGNAVADVAPRLPGLPVHMVGHLRDQVVDMRLKIGAIHPLDVRAVDRMPEVADHGVDHKRLAMAVEVGAPGVGHAVDHLLHHTAARVIPPDAGVDLDPLGVG